MRVLGVLCVLVLCAAPVMAQHQHGGTTKARELYPGLGNYHHPITTQNPEAQTYFDQGLTLLYGFNHDEAARYFRRAAELDPEAAMPYWGLALAIGPNYNDTAVDENRAPSHVRCRPEGRRTRAEGECPRAGLHPRSGEALPVAERAVGLEAVPP